MIEQKADRISPSVDRSVIDSLVHTIVSHHGKYEFGSPKLPATAEAIMVNYIDDLDAKMNYVFDLVENDPSDTDWTSWKRSDVTIGTKYYRKKISDEEEQCD
jgi:3'-5' exoribonuclease